MTTHGTLFVVATPLGNLEDITLRALRILKEVDLIAAEDTRHSRHLLQHFHIDKMMISLHDFNEKARIHSLLEKLSAGKNVALISDAGTPLISDPGYLLVQACHHAHVPVVPIPGACAAIAALCVSGLPTDQFVFEGFLPAKSADRRRYLQSLLKETRTLVFYEAPHRILKMVADLIAIFGEDRPMTLAKELTKTFETVFMGNTKAVYTWLQQDKHHQQGEFVVMVQGATPPAADELSAEAIAMLQALAAHLPWKKAVELTAQLTGARKNALYGLVGTLHFGHIPE